MTEFVLMLLSSCWGSALITFSTCIYKLRNAPLYQPILFFHSFGVAVVTMKETHGVDSIPRMERVHRNRGKSSHTHTHTHTHTDKDTISNKETHFY